MTLQHSNDATLERHVLSRAQQALRPEIFAHITEKLVFNRLSYEHQLEIAEKFLAREIEFFAARGHKLELDKTVLPFLVRKGFHPKLGARPMRDAVEKLVGDAWPGICSPEKIPAADCRWTSRATVSLSIEQTLGGGALPPRRLHRLAFAQFFHANFVGLTAQHPTIDVVNPRTEFRATAMFADGHKVAPLKRGDQLAGASAIAVGFDGHAPDGFGDRGHNAKSICWGWFSRADSPASNRRISSGVRGMMRLATFGQFLEPSLASIFRFGAKRLARNPP